ncbi:hypothetical protein CVS30_01255 [Arthrobacter psychrolactophilus]|uniref:Wadjet protein JetD C-terminal domain-containing protein n=1 Tax=Arthrobacter psychrolactophilus TaxID=92442 RepID=A0A2V5IUI1_9MICC|nr:Wadjet anti-phage system protein JetD domain-containing protein [Arthrobacter psychrolactophilus]PYI40175.1 hypothetical protein CVS30_01255 [Arthrobacter psychrolactophilus]
MAAKSPAAGKAPTWTTPADVRTASLRSWNSGELLRELVLPTGLHPRRRPLKHPSATQLRSDYSLAAAWAASWDPAPRGCVLEYVSVGATTIGANTLPSAVIFNSAAEEIAFLGMGREAARFTKLTRLVAAIAAGLETWALLRPLELLKHGDDALTAARVAVWLAANPAPGIYLRQLSLPGVHTKFVENHRRLIDGMMSVLTPERLLEGKNYARRHGFLAAPDRVRIRFLDPMQGPLPGISDIEVTADAFTSLVADVDRIITTENLVNFLALPPAPRTLAVFGGGYGFEGIRDAVWLADKEVLYWGDIDTHGFQILDQLRSHHPHVRSILMDEETLLEHRDFWGHEDAPSHAVLTHLSVAESALYAALQNGTFAPKLRLEQELLRWDWAMARLGQTA